MAIGAVTSVLASVLTFVGTGATNLTSVSAWQEGAAYGGKCDFGYGTRFRGKVCDFTVTGRKGGDTAWCVRTRRFEVPKGVGAFRLAFRIFCDDSWTKPVGKGNWSHALVWYDSDGREIGDYPFETRFAGGRFHPFVFGGVVPEGAVSGELRFGNDFPNLFVGDCVAVDRLSLDFIPAGDGVPESVSPGILRPPVVRLVNAGPLSDSTQPLVFRVEGDDPVDPESFRLLVDRTNLTTSLVRDGLVWRLSGRNWSPGAHRCEIRIADIGGDWYYATKVFWFGEAPRTPKVTLREDGMTLVDGKPFFPIGAYAICRREFNGNNLDRAFADLKAAGFNLGHSYYSDRDPEFYAAAGRHGMKLWVNAREVTSREGDAWLADVGRGNPSILAWYLGDDTSDNSTVAAMFNRGDSVRALDGTRLTCQADGVLNGEGGAVEDGRSRYADYVDCTDVFMPEIYSLIKSENETACVARVVRDMELAKVDMARRGCGVRKGLWPVLQHFRGYGHWERYPTLAEQEAMTMAAIVHGANGIIWYTYGGSVKSGNYGLCATPEAWMTITNVSRRLAAHMDVLQSVPASRQPVLEVQGGPKYDFYGNPSVTMLRKDLDGYAYVFAVNATKTTVKVGFSAPSSEGCLVSDHGCPPIQVDRGFVIDVFSGFATRIYRFRIE